MALVHLIHISASSQQSMTAFSSVSRISSTTICTSFSCDAVHPVPLQPVRPGFQYLNYRFHHDRKGPPDITDWHKLNSFMLKFKTLALGLIPCLTSVRIHILIFGRWWFFQQRSYQIRQEIQFFFSLLPGARGTSAILAATVCRCRPERAAS